MLKKVISLMLAVCVVFSMGISVIAVGNDNGIASYYLYTYDATSKLSISNKTASCKSVLTGLSTATKITATQYLEKKNGSKWGAVSGGTWSDSTNKNSLTMSNSKSDLSSGTYRLRTVFKVYSGVSYETFEKTSSEVTV